MMKRILPLVMLFLLVLCAGCSSDGGSGDEAPAPAAPEPPAAARTATATLEAKSGSSLTGSATFTQVGDAVRLELHVNGAPDGEHAVHIHERGDCSAADGTSAGGHWNPTAEDHGRWGQPPHHLGDIGNMQVDDSGHGMITLATDLWSIGTGAANDVLGKASIVHAGDLGNMWVGEDGVGHHVILMPELTVSPGSHSVVGRGIIVHAGVDDLVSQPTGAAGGRIGCGVIR